MKFFQKKNKSNLIAAWALSYVLVISVMLCATIIVSLIYNSTSKKISNDFNEYVFETVTSDVKDTLNSMNNLYMSINSNEKIPTMLSYSNIFIQEVSYDVIQDLNSYKAFSENIDNVFLYLKDRDMVIAENGIIPSYLFYISYFNPEKISYTDWKEMLISCDEDYYYSTVPYKNKNDTDTNAISLLFSVSRTKNNCVGVILSNHNNLVKGLEKINWDNLCDIYIYNRSGTLATYSKNSEKGELPETFKQIASYENGRNTIHESDIVVNGHAWKLVTVAPNSDANKNLLITQIVIVSLIFMSLILLVFVVNRILKRNYSPIKKMLSFFNITETSNEYEALFKSIDEALNKNLTLSKELDNHNENLKKINLAKLLRGEKFYSRSNSPDLVFKDNSFCVLTFFLENISDLFRDEGNMSDSEKLFYLSLIIDNVISELLAQKQMSVYTTEIDGQVVCLVNFDGETHTIEDVKALSDSGHVFISQSFDISLTYALSSAHEDVLNIPVAYSQTLEVLEYQRVLGIKEPMQYIDSAVVSDKNRYIFDLHKEQTLINAIKTGNHQTAITVLNQIFTALENEKDLSFDYIIYVLLDVASTITKSANEILLCGIDLDESLMFYRKIKDGESLINLYTQMSEYILKFCEEVKDNLKDGKNRVNFLISHIEKYIADNYTDAELNTNSIGIHFNMNSDYISTVFKKETGKSLLNYINNLRIIRAVELINEGRYSKKDISKMVGFTTERTFYRILKKYEENVKNGKTEFTDDE